MVLYKIKNTKKYKKIQKIQKNVSIINTCSMRRAMRYLPLLTCVCVCVLFAIHDRAAF